MEKILLKTIVLGITTKNAHRELTEYTFRCYFSISWYFDLAKMHCLPKLTRKLPFWANTYGHRKKWNVNYHKQSITKKWWLASLAELCGILKPFESYKNPYRERCFLLNSFILGTKCNCYLILHMYWFHLSLNCFINYSQEGASM